MSISPMMPPPWGVCLSGGGIRSASFCLGALQEMQRFDPVHPLIQGPEAQTSTAQGSIPPYVPGRANFITSVSGGSYIASAIVFVAQGSVNGEPDVPQLKLSKRDPAATTEVVETVTVAPDEAFAAGSPEERYLRDHTRYLSHGFGGPLAAIWQLLVSILLNLFLLSLAVMILAVPIGWLYGHLIPALQAGNQAIYHFSFTDAGWPLVPAIAGGAALILAFVWVVAVTANPSVNKILLGTSLALVGVVLAWLCFAVGIPIVLEWLHRSVGSPAGATAAAPSSTTKELGAAAGTGTAASVLIALLGTRVARTVKAGWDDVPKGIQARLVQQGKSLLLRFRVPLINLLILLIGPFTLLCLFLLGAHVGALYPAWTEVGRTWDPFFGALVGSGLLVLMYLLANVTKWSLHPFYRERLSDAFCLKRFELENQTDIANVREDKKTRNEAWLPTEVNGQFADHRPYVYSYQISAVQPATMPQLIVCASANVSTYGATPTGFRSTSFVFSKDKIGGGLLGKVSAQDYEAVVTKFSTGSDQGHRRPRARHAGRQLAHDHQRHPIRRSRRGLLHPAQPGQGQAPCARPAPQDGLLGDARAPGGCWVTANLRLRSGRNGGERGMDEVSAPAVPGRPETHPVHDVANTEFDVGVGPTDGSAHAEMTEGARSSKPGEGNGSDVQHEAKSPLDIHAHEHAVGARGLLHECRIQLTRAEHPEGTADRPVGIAYTGSVDAGDRPGVADAVRRRDLGGMKTRILPDVRRREGPTGSPQGFGQCSVTAEVRGELGQEVGRRRIVPGSLAEVAETIEDAAVRTGLERHESGNA